MAETCKGCGAIQKEEWPKGKAAYRCMAPESERRGHVSEVEKAEFTPSVLRPAWCPSKGKTDA